MKFKRTNTCGELVKKDIKKEVCLMGWVCSSRDHGGIIFIDLRDRYGITQVVFNPKHDKKGHKEAEVLRREDVISVRGKVRARGKGLENPKLKTGQIEVLVDDVEVLNKAETPPLEVEDRIDMNEDVRLKYRYLDLRRPTMQRNILLRHKAVKFVRDYFDGLGFLEIETPALSKSTPEGARDYLVPSRVNPGKFYALPQSPQILKQICMISGFDKYFQIVKCFRDEDLRADRQPEFTQIDVEMSFVEQEDVFLVIEGLLRGLWKKILGKDVKGFKKITYEEAMSKYGTDKPDLRFGLELVDVSDIVPKSKFEVFTKVVSGKGKVKCVNAKKCSGFSRKDLDALIEFVKIYDAKGMAWMKVTEKGLESNIVKYFDEKVQRELIKATDAKKGDLLLFVADHKHHIVDVALGHLRNKLARGLKLTSGKEDSFVWVTDFPLLEFDEDEQKHVAVHHPFTSPRDEDLKFLDSDVEKVRAKAYDITLNGVEIGGGSIRIHEQELQKKMFKILGISEKDAMGKFGFLLNAFKYGAPPHGGIALGMDRIVAILTGNTSIREVIAFPKTKNAEDLMMETPNVVDEKQLKELNVKLDLVGKK
jgi:aspartyl-tRNA synthetase|tara:strand:+ start:454 stop:2229 length:1776 start_codon:yes stop_codon:yes gene_type:complete